MEYRGQDSVGAGSEPAPYPLFPDIFYYLGGHN